MTAFGRILTLVCLLGVMNAEAYTVDAIKKEYGAIFSVELSKHDGKTWTAQGVKKLPKAHFLAGFVNNHNLYIDYILSNYGPKNYKGLIALADDPVELEAYFVQSLRADSVFNVYFLEATHRYLSSIGKGIEGHLLHDRTRITVDSLMSIGSRFYYATNFSTEGKIDWHICVGFNGYLDTRKSTLIPLVEAFCFEVIMEHGNETKSNAFEDFKKNALALKEDYKDDKSDENLERCRQKMYRMMSGSESLRALLTKHYRKSKGMLSFELTDDR